MKRGFLLLCLFGAMATLWAEVKVTIVEVRPRWPWNGLIDITYSIEREEVDDDGKPRDVYVYFKGIDNDRNMEIAMKTLTGDGAKEPVKYGGPYTVTWNMVKDAPTFNSSAFQVDIHAIEVIAPYLVIDLKTWKKRYTSLPPNLDDDTCRTTELWLRRIPAGTFRMGSPDDEIGRTDFEVQHEVTLTQDYYIGVFECTQKQWELVMGDSVAYYEGDCRPVEQVSYDMIRGMEEQAGAGWPAYGHSVDSTSFMGKLQSKTGLTFDLPTEAQWEYACRAGTTTALNSGKNLTVIQSDAAMDEVGRYWYNQNDGKGGYSEYTAKVGSYLPNAWGLYDMHGNVYEWCLDWWEDKPSSTEEGVTNPSGPVTGLNRVVRGGGWYNYARGCRSANRDDCNSSSYYGDIGFRVFCLLPDR